MKSSACNVQSTGAVATTGVVTNSTERRERRAFLMSIGRDLGGPAFTELEGTVITVAAAPTLGATDAITQEEDLEVSSPSTLPSLNRNERFSLSTNLVWNLFSDD